MNPLSLVPILSLAVGNHKSHPLGFQTGESSLSFEKLVPPSEPMLISSIVPYSTTQNNAENRYLMLVERVVGALATPSPSDESINDSCNDYLSPSQEVDDDMLLRHYQKDAKSKAIARRSPSKWGKKPKKGRQSPIY